MFLEHTPIEKYKVGDVPVYVKREDLYGQEPMPPLAKLRGIRIVLHNAHNQGIKDIGVLDTRVSKSGQGVAAVIKEYYPSMQLHLGYPVTKANRSVPVQHKIAEELGAKLYPCQATRQSIMWYRFRNEVHKLGGVMLPHGLPFTETAGNVAEEAQTVPKAYLQGSLVLIVGTGTMLAGILAGLEILPHRIVGISAGKARTTQLPLIRDILNALLPFQSFRLGAVELLDPLMPYEKQDLYPCPFPSHPNYDRKAWHWMCEHIEELPKPILFWNIGA